MKKLLTLSLVALGFFFIAAPYIAPHSYPLYVNGKLIGNAVVVEGGILAISLEDFAKATGAPLTLEPLFQLQGNRLSSKLSTVEYLKHTGSPAAGKIREAALSPAVKIDPAAKIKYAPGQIFTIQRPGVISSHLVMMNGKMFIPLTDVARALGNDTLNNFGNLKPGDAIRLNFAKNQNSIIAILIGL